MGSLRLRSQLPDQIHFGLAVWRSIGAKDFMKPDGRVTQDVRMLPRLPWIVSLRFAGDESPVDRAHVLLPGYRKNCVKGAANRSRHVLGTDNGAVESSKPRNFRFERFRPAVVMERNDIRFAQLDLR